MRYFYSLKHRLGLKNIYTEQFAGCVTDQTLLVVFLEGHKLWSAVLQYEQFQNLISQMAAVKELIYKLK